MIDFHDYGRDAMNVTCYQFITDIFPDEHYIRNPGVAGVEIKTCPNTMDETSYACQGGSTHRKNESWEPRLANRVLQGEIMGGHHRLTPKQQHAKDVWEIAGPLLAELEELRVNRRDEE